MERMIAAAWNLTAEDPMQFRPRISIKTLLCTSVLFLLLFMVESAYCAASGYLLNIDPSMSSLSFRENGVIIGGPYPISGRFRITTGVDLHLDNSSANMELANLDIQTPPLPKERFQLPANQGFLEGQTFTSSGDPCAYWSGPGTCYSQGVFDYCSGNWVGSTVIINGIQRIDGWLSSYEYKIVASVIPKGAAEARDQLVKLNGAILDLVNRYESPGLSSDEAMTAILDLQKLKNETLTSFPTIFGLEFSRLYFGLRSLDRWTHVAKNSTFLPTGPPVLSSIGEQAREALLQAEWETYGLIGLLVSAQDENTESTLSELDRVFTLLAKTTTQLAGGAKNLNRVRRAIDGIEQGRLRAVKTLPDTLGLPFSDWCNLFDTLDAFLDAVFEAQNRVTFSGSDPFYAPALLRSAKNWGEALETYLSSVR